MVLHYNTLYIHIIHYYMVHHLAVPSGWDRPRGAATSPTVGSGHGLVPASWRSWILASGEFPRNNGKVIGKSWENVWKTYRKHMENIWETYGKHMENIWKTYGKHMENIWKSWKTWKNHGKHMENKWKTYGTHMENIWEVRRSGALNGRISEVFIVGMLDFSWSIEAELVRIWRRHFYPFLTLKKSCGV